MRSPSPLQEAIDLVGLVALARGLGVSHQAVRNWQRAGRMPRTEWTGETSYSVTIERLTGGKVQKAGLLAKWPPADSDAANAALIASTQSPSAARAALN